MDGPVHLIEGYAPGLLARVVALHMAYYAPAWGFGRAFEAKVAGELAAFLNRYDPDRDLLLRAETAAGRITGAIVIDGQDAAAAHLRWFIVAQPGQGLGRKLMAHALAFCRAQGFASVTLTTFAGLDAARRLYDQAGFALEAESARDQWQGGVKEQRMRLDLKRDGPV